MIFETNKVEEITIDPKNFPTEAKTQSNIIDTLIINSIDRMQEEMSEMLSEHCYTLGLKKKLKIKIELKIKAEETK